MRRLFFAVPLLIAASPQTAAEPPPTVLAPYIHDGAFEPGDYRWLRGEFDGSNANDKANDAAILAWRKRCRVNDMKQTRAELTAMGISAGPSLERIPYRSLICDQVASLPEPLDLRDWEGFARDVTKVQPIAQGFLAGVKLAEQAAAPDSPALGDMLNAKLIGDQVLRRGLDWASGGASDAPVLSLTPQQRGILVSEIAIAMARRDHDNTEWLKGVVASQGWPTRTKVGDSAATVAWLLVQHADADPAFQARALRLMEPLAATGEVNKKNYAYLYDRVMLKLVGKQRYATQLTCRAGQYVPLPVEDDREVDSWRRKAGMGALADYQRQVTKNSGPCSDGPTGS